MMVEGWAENHGVQIHYIDTSGDAAIPLVPIVFIPGALGSAEDYVPEMSSLAPRRCIAVSLRGRGLSNSPKIGYSFDHHVADIEAVIKETGLSAFCLMGYSLGVTDAIGYSSRHPQLLAGLIIADYPARHPAYSPEWVDRTLSEIPERAAPHVVRALQRESAEVLLWDSLSQIECPTLVLRGGQSGSLLTLEAAERYQERLRNVKVVVLNCRHDLTEDYDRFIDSIKVFLEEIDSGI